jgi:hypothetical protein
MQSNEDVTYVYGIALFVDEKRKHNAAYKSNNIAIWFDQPVLKDGTEIELSNKQIKKLPSLLQKVFDEKRKITSTENWIMGANPSFSLQFDTVASVKFWLLKVVTKQEKNDQDTVKKDE